MTNEYFFDTYALIEIIRGNPVYKNYEKFEIFTTKLNLFELCHNLTREFDFATAKQITKTYIPNVVEYDEDVIWRAVELKRSNRNLSMADCIGYAAALEWGLIFLTGDKEFEHLPNVEFVK